jgi:hypothetical protein
MMDLSKIFIDWFDDRQHSNAELLAYTSQHLAILSAPANNPGNVFNAIIAATNTAQTAFATCIGDKTLNAGVRKAANLGKKNFRESLRGPIQQVEAAVIVAFGKGSPDYVACFPEGRSGITEAREDELKPRLQALHGALTARSGTAGIPAQATVVNGLITTWTALLAAADVADGTESGSAEQRRACRKDLTKQLWRNVLTIALQFIDQPEKASLYLPTHLLENAQQQPPGAPVLTVHGGIGQFDVTAEVSNADEVEFFGKLGGAAEFSSLGVKAPGETLVVSAPAGFAYVKAVARNGAGDGPESDVVEVEVT